MLHFWSRYWFVNWYHYYFFKNWLKYWFKNIPSSFFFIFKYIFKWWKVPSLNQAAAIQVEYTTVLTSVLSYIFRVYLRTTFCIITLRNFTDSGGYFLLHQRIMSHHNPLDSFLLLQSPRATDILHFYSPKQLQLSFLFTYLITEDQDWWRHLYEEINPALHLHILFSISTYYLHSFFTSYLILSMLFYWRSGRVLYEVFRGTFLPY